MKIGRLFLSLQIIFLGYQGELAVRPVRIFHGLGDYCEETKDPNTNYKCVETGAKNESFRKSIKTQAMIGCEILKSEVDILQPSFYVLAYSQGGLIARWIQLNCEGVGHLIKRMVLVGTPNIGVDKFPKNDAFVDKVFSKHDIESMIYNDSSWLKSLSEDERKKSIKELFEKTLPNEEAEDSWLADKGISVANLMSPLLKPLNFAPLNYINEKSQYASLITDLSKKSNIGSLNTLDFLVVIANRDERVVSPPENVTFGMQIVNDFGNTKKYLKTSKFINTHPMINHLWKEKRLINCLSDSSHAGITDNEFSAIKDILFSEDITATNYKSSSIKIKDKFLKDYPNFCCFNDPNKTSLQLEYYETTNEKAGVSNIRLILGKILI